LNGEGSLAQYTLRGAPSNDVSEGGQGKVFQAKFRVNGGDLLLSRIDFVLSNGNKEPWHDFQSTTLWVNGEKVRTQPVNASAYWEDNGSITSTQAVGLQYYGFTNIHAGDKLYGTRFPQINQVLKNGKEYTFTIALTAQNGVNDTPQNWNMFVDDKGIRATTHQNFNVYTGDQGPAGIQTFQVKKVGADNNFKVISASNNPVAGTIQVNQNNTTDNQDILAFRLDNSNSSNDVRVDHIPVVIKTMSATTKPSDVVNNYKLTIDGNSYSDYTLGTVHSGNGSSTQVVDFNINRDQTVSAGNIANAVLSVDFKSTNGGSQYSNGTVISASVNSDPNDNATNLDVTADVTNHGVTASGAASGEKHTLYSTGVKTNEATTNATTVYGASSSDDVGVYTFNINLSAFDHTEYIKKSGDAFDVEIVNGSGASAGAVSTSTSVAVKSSGATLENGYYRIDAGMSEPFQVTATYNPPASAQSGLYSAHLKSVVFGQSATASAATSSYALTPVGNYETNYIQINN
jgi:hypothetical protein